MAQLFPKWTNKLPVIVLGVVGFSLVGAVGFVWYYASPWYTDVGYRPIQPVPYSHKLHAGDLGIDCRYCHSNVEKSANATVPPTQTCMNCHKIIRPDSPNLKLIRESYESKKPMAWVKVHKNPDYAYFNHAAHVTVGVSCVSCHGNVAEMEVVSQKEPLSMGWCLECHRNPGAAIRPVSEITNMYWEPNANGSPASSNGHDRKLNPPQDCNACHR